MPARKGFMADCPKISVITPSFNQAAFLERTIRSVIEQRYPNLEYIIIDGGSTDGSVDIIRRYADRITYWVSEPDSGQANAINKGLRRASGEWVAWQNSDDVYYPGALHAIADVIRRNPDAAIVTGDIMLIDENDHEIRDIHYIRPSYGAMLAEGMMLPNQATFWRRTLHTEVGWIDESLHYAFDYEWFLRLIHGRRAAHTSHILGGYRLHDETKTSLHTQRFSEENFRILKGRQLKPWARRLYQCRRMMLLLAQGNVRYVMRGLCRRLRLQIQEIL